MGRRFCRGTGILPVRRRAVPALPIEPAATGASARALLIEEVKTGEEEETDTAKMAVVRKKKQLRKKQLRCPAGPEMPKTSMRTPDCPNQKESRE